MDIEKINILVAMDMSPMDEALIQYIGVARNIYPNANFTFLHNIKMSELPPEYKSPEKLETISKSITERIHEMIETAGTVPQGYKVEVSSLSFTEHAFLNTSKKIGAHLAIVGNKQNLEGDGGMARKLIRMWRIATLLVPETFNKKPQKLMQAIDFSKYTPTINRVSAQIILHNQLGIKKVEPVYVSKVSWQFFPGPGEKEIKKIIEDDTKAKKARWQKENPASEPLTVLSGNEKSIAIILTEYINQTKVDLAILGVLGVSSLTGLFLGSVSNQLISQETDACILLVK